MANGAKIGNLWDNSRSDQFHHSMSQTNRTTMVCSIFGVMCWFVDPAGNRGILVLYCSVFVAESSFCNMHVYAVKSPCIRTNGWSCQYFWNVSSDSCRALLKLIMGDWGLGLYRTFPIPCWYVRSRSPLILGFNVRKFAGRRVSVRATPGFENLNK